MGRCVLLRPVAVLVLLLFVLCTINRAANQSSAATGGSGRTEILFLGTSGGPLLHEDRSEPATLLIVDGRAYLIDCGIGTIRQLVRAGIPSETIKTIFFTHLHPDHVLGLADLMANDFQHASVAAESKGINIYGPLQTAELVEAAFRYISIPYSVFSAERLSTARLSSPFRAHEFQRDGLVFQDDRIRVIAAENSHYALMPAKFRVQMKSYSYRIETRHGVVVFTGDTGPSEAVIRLAKGADVLITEASGGTHERTVRFVNQMAEQNHWTPQRTKEFMGHMTQEHLDLEHVAELASKAQVKSVLFYHYNPPDPTAYVADVKKTFTGPVFAPADLDRYCLGAASGDANAPVEPCPEQSTEPSAVVSSSAVAPGSKNPLGNDPAQFDARVESASLRNDVGFFQVVLAPDVRFSHGTGIAWDKQQWLKAVPVAKFTSRDLDSVQVEPHGDVVETTGHIHIKSGNPRHPGYEIWYVRVYEREHAGWRLLSNRTVRR